MNFKNKGFSFIEMSVAIIAILIVYLFILFPIKGNVDIVKDTVRKSNIDLITSIIRLEGLSNNEHNIYKIPRNNLLTALESNVKNMPEADSGKHYFYGYSKQNKDFFVVICNEKSSRLIKNGSKNGLEAISLILPEKVCDNNFVHNEHLLPFEITESNKNINTYHIYQLI